MKLSTLLNKTVTLALEKNDKIQSRRTFCCLLLYSVLRFVVSRLKMSEPRKSEHWKFFYKERHQQTRVTSGHFTNWCQRTPKSRHKFLSPRPGLKLIFAQEVDNLVFGVRNGQKVVILCLDIWIDVCHPLFSPQEKDIKQTSSLLAVYTPLLLPSPHSPKRTKGDKTPWHREASWLELCALKGMTEKGRHLVPPGDGFYDHHESPLDSWWCWPLWSPWLIRSEKKLGNKLLLLRRGVLQWHTTRTHTNPQRSMCSKELQREIRLQFFPNFLSLEEEFRSVFICSLKVNHFLFWHLSETDVSVLANVECFQRGGGWSWSLSGKTLSKSVFPWMSFVFRLVVTWDQHHNKAWGAWCQVWTISKTFLSTMKTLARLYEGSAGTSYETAFVPELETKSFRCTCAWVNRWRNTAASKTDSLVMLCCDLFQRHFPCFRCVSSEAL